MKLCRVGPKGAEKPAVVLTDGSIRDISSLIYDIDGRFLSEGGLEKILGADLSSLPVIEAGTRYGVPVASVGKIVCAGMNYSDHCEEAGFDIPEQPALFMKATSSLSGANDAVQRPEGSTQLDWEIELAVVIGRRACNVSEQTALNYVAGYTILNDVTDRDFQFNKGGQWFKGKSADTFCPVGPWIVTADEIDDPQDLHLSLDLNDSAAQRGTTEKMIFSVAQLIAHTSRYMTLEPGDILSTGTPPGVGMGHKPEPRWLRDGDKMALKIDGLGQQEYRVQ